MRKEPIVFLVFAAIIAYLWSDMLGTTGRSRPPQVKPKDYESSRLPDVDLALADPDRDVEFERDLFSPPSPTSPLPPLVVQLPPLEPLGALAPPTGWGPQPSLFGQFLRRPARPETARDIPGLFDDLGGGDFDVVPIDPSENVDSVDDLSDDPDARAAQIAGLKTQYDWIYTNKFQFGQILNEDRYTLPDQDQPALTFLPVDPATGKPVFRDPLQYEAGKIDEFGLVDNALTKVEVGLARFGNPLAPSEFEDALQFADECLLLRNETDRALPIAEELYTRAQAINVQDDARPRLGLAACYQLGFRLEDAYDTYQDLLRSGHDTNAGVHARLGVLLTQLRMTESAEVSFREALRVERTNWEARYWYGRFLVQQGRVDESLEHLKEAVLREPKAPEDKAFRVRIRLENAGALLRAGKMQEAFQAFGVAASADMANEIGMQEVAAAGLVTAMRFMDMGEMGPGMGMGGGGMGAGGGGGMTGELSSDGPVVGGFEVLLNAGLFAIDMGAYELAAQTLGLAADADPFRRYEALRALSRVAEITGNPEDAVSFIEEALAGDPGDPWSLYQRGRLYEEAGDETEARAAYRAALDVELDLGPALERMAALLQSAGDHVGSERYYERAVGIEPERAVLWSRRGWNALQNGDLPLAEECFRQARRLSPSLSSARAGVAWWHYASGDPREATTLFGEIVDDARSSGTEGPVSDFAQAQADRIADHESKEVWTDRFDRAAGRVGNGWTLDQGFGPLVELRDDAVKLSGQKERAGRTRIFQSLPPDRFLAVSGEITVGAEAKGTRSGMFITSERTRPGGEPQVTAEVSVCRNRDGQLEVRVQKTPTDDDAKWKTVVGPEWPIDQPIRVSIERVGDDLDASFTLYVDGEPVATNIECDRLTSSRQPVHFGVFASGDAGRRADVTLDDVRVVRRR